MALGDRVEAPSAYRPRRHYAPHKETVSMIKQILILLILVLVMGGVGFKACKEYQRYNPDVPQDMGGGEDEVVEVQETAE